MKIIAIDFDDTLFEYVPLSPGIDDYSGRPDSIGEPIWNNITDAIVEQVLDSKLILCTCRKIKADEYWDDKAVRV